MSLIDLENAPPDAVGTPGIQPGDVFRKDGGPGGIWVIISVSETGYCYVMGFDTQGNPQTASRYGCHYFERKTKVGHVKGFDSKWEIDWL